MTRWICDYLYPELGHAGAELLKTDECEESRLALLSAEVEVSHESLHRLKHFWRIFEDGLVGPPRAVPGLEWQATSGELLRCLISILQTKERATLGHSVRTSSMARAYAHGLLLPQSQIDALGAAALLHDIGKICIPNRILLKREVLFPGEWLLLKEHVEVGARILAAVGMDPLVVETVRSHHERFDGSGYPNGAKGEQIPLLARVLAIADCFDAMTSVRPYRDAWSPDDVMRHICSKAGTQFDPQIVTMLCALPVSTWLARARRFASGLK